MRATTFTKIKQTNIIITFSTTWEISAIWLAESRGISALFEVPTCENYSYHSNQNHKNLIIMQVTKKSWKDCQIMKFMRFKNGIEIQKTKW